MGNKNKRFREILQHAEDINDAVLGTQRAYQRVINKMTMRHESVAKANEHLKEMNLYFMARHAARTEEHKSMNILLSKAMLALYDTWKKLTAEGVVPITQLREGRACAERCLREMGLADALLETEVSGGVEVRRGHVPGGGEMRPMEEGRGWFYDDGKKKYVEKEMPNAGTPGRAKTV